jgi:glycosyltransferase EpsJ
MGDLISVIIPVYNVEKYIDRCIISIINQTYKNLEIILVDDGSRDNSGKICDEYEKKDSRIKVIHKDNAGAGMARNTGIENMSGQYFAFIDSDDYVDCDYIEKMFDAIKEYNVDACISAYSKVYSDRVETYENKMGTLVFKNEDVKKMSSKMLGKLPDGSDFIEPSPCKALLSSKILKDNNIKFVSENNLICEDLIFNLNYYLKANSVVKIDYAGYYYCDNIGSLTTRYNPSRFEAHKKLCKYLLDFVYKNKMGNEETDMRIKTNFINNIRHCIRLENSYASINGKENARKQIKNMCNDPMVEEIFNTYPNHMVSLKSRIFNICIKKKIYFPLFLLKRK